MSRLLLVSKDPERNTTNTCHDAGDTAIAQWCRRYLGIADLAFGIAPVFLREIDQLRRRPIPKCHGRSWAGSAFCNRHSRAPEKGRAIGWLSRARLLDVTLPDLNGLERQERVQEVPREMEPLVTIVDDDESIREAVAGLINLLGFHAQAFPSAVDFLASSSIAASSCLIADVQMPDMTGFELYRRLVEMGRPVPTILITAYPDDAARTRALAAGVACYLGKPFDTDTLIGCVRSALNSQAG